MFVCDKHGAGVIVSGVWPPIPIDEWQLTIDPRKVEQFTRKPKKDMKAALGELDWSVESPDPATKTQPRVLLEKAVPHLPSPSEFPLDSGMKLEETFENDSELGNPIVGESDWAPTTQQKPLKMLKQEKRTPPEPPPVPQGGSQKASHLSPKMMLPQAQRALKERVANNINKTKKKKVGVGANSTKQKRLAVELDSDTTAKSEAYEAKPAPKTKKGDGGKSLLPNAPREKKNAKANVPPQPQARQENEGRTKIKKKRRAQTKQVTVAHHNEMSGPHPKKTHPPLSCLLAFHVM